MHSSEKRLILLHSPQNKKRQNKNALSEKQKQVEVLFKIEMTDLFLKLNWLIFNFLWQKPKETIKKQTRNILRKSFKKHFPLIFFLWC